MQKVLLELKDIKKVFKKGSELIKVLDGINLNIHEKQTIGIIGPSGSGKSTLIKLTNAYCTFVNGGKKVDPILMPFHLVAPIATNNTNQVKSQVMDASHIAFLNR